MSPERWQKIEQLHHAALEREPGGRSAFLDQACQGDAELHREVEALLAQRDAAGDSTVTLLGPGAQLGPYKIEAPIGAGGMGSVYRAVDTRLGRKVAIKICAQQFSGRFEREARAISSLNHPHICTLYDIGPNYLVMELAEGETLAARLKKAPLPTELVLRYGAQLADALAAAHALGIIHRDLKPQNIMITKSGVKVLDFGLAKSPRDETLTAAGVVMGTPAYMAPEQLEGKECDDRSDIYALGLVLYEMAVGKRLPRGQPPVMEGLPPQFAHVIERCVESEPENRWQSASDVKRELEWAGKTQVTMQESESRKGLPHLPQPSDEAVMAHVLYMDVVDSTRVTADEQRRTNDRLKELVAETHEVQAARDCGELISLPTGDGMALVFLGKFEAPLRCAIEIAQALRAEPFCGLRMGIHTGPVYRSPDINGMLNVSGAGINIAARVMSCGGGGHILVSGNAAEPLRSLSAWKGKLHDLGEFQAKKDRVLIWNYLDGEVGSAAPVKALSTRTIQRRRFGFGGILALCVIAAVWWISRAVPPAERSFAYSLWLKQPAGQPREITPDAMPPGGSELKLKFSSPQGGYLYLLAEGRGQANQRSWVWLFPEPGYQSGSGEISPGSNVSIPTPSDAYIQLDSNPGQEIVHMIWSDSPVEQLESIKKSLFTALRYELSDGDAASASRITAQASPPAEERRHSDVFVHGKGAQLITSFTLGHL